MQNSNGDGPTIIKQDKEQDQKQADIASPKRVEELLGLGKKEKTVTIIEQQLAESGFVFKDEDS